MTYFYAKPERNAPVTSDLSCCVRLSAEIDRCDIVNGDCDHFCEWDPVNFTTTCSCSHGFVLADDGHTCVRDASTLRKF